MITITIRADATRAIAAFAYAAHTSALHALRCGITRRQLTTGAENWCFECEDVHPPGQHTDPEPCCCSYRLFTTRFSLDDFRGPIIRRVVLGSYFTISERCIHHGGYLRDHWIDGSTDQPWENTLGPDETQP